jgi:GDP-fucose protein O-fucosyltransferase
MVAIRTTSQSRKMVCRLCSNFETMVLVAFLTPYYLDSFVPSAHIQQIVQQNRPTETYYCLHARVEADWFYHCCNEDVHDPNLDPDRPDTWRCSYGKPPTRCYQTPAQIARTLLQALPHSSTLWVASGASRAALEPLYQLFQVKRLESTVKSTHFMDYDLALADREICAGAKTAWVMGESTFSKDIGKHTKRILYNKIRPTN